MWQSPKTHISTENTGDVALSPVSVLDPNPNVNTVGNNDTLLDPAESIICTAPSRRFSEITQLRHSNPSGPSVEDCGAGRSSRVIDEIKSQK